MSNMNKLTKAQLIEKIECLEKDLSEATVNFLDEKEKLESCLLRVDHLREEKDKLHEKFNQSEKTLMSIESSFRGIQNSRNSRDKAMFVTGAVVGVIAYILAKIAISVIH